MEANFNQLDILLKLIQERSEDIRVMATINQQVQVNQKNYDVEFNQVQQSLRQMGFKVIAMKKHDKPRQDEENKILEYLSKITTLNLPERMYIYKFCQTIIKLFKPEMQIVRFNQKDTKDLLLMFKQYFMAENNIEILQQIQQLMMDQEFKMTSALVLIKILVNKSREDFHNLIQTTSAIVISKIKAKLSEQQQNQKQIVNEQQKQIDLQDSESNESPKTKLWIQRKTSKQREQSNSLVYQKPAIILRSVSMIDKLLVAQSQQQSYQQQLMSQQQQIYINPERELKLQLRAQQKKLKKRLHSNYKAMFDLDFDNFWAMHIILKKKFIKHSDKYFLQRGGFYIWSQLKLLNQSIRQTINNHQLKRIECIQADKLTNEQIQVIHRVYNTTCQSPRKLPQLPNIQLKSQSPQIIKQNKFVSNLSFLPQLQFRNQQLIQQQQQAYQQVSQKPISYYDPNKDFTTSAQRSNKSLNLSQDQIRRKKSEHNSEIILYK
ncbi:unnamed protein product [Paramecium primaurelia]|uniref:Uncharacterized protein n=1 Tax=Paramecium primaurelia TaxID=5886 RepID=A0A8S1L2L5_PARPR|nr:unnamed protein product [Paramecium primaurelia]